jgi:hypothetical protein
MRGKPFQPGNKYGRGRPRGSPNKIASVCQDTLDSHAENLTKKCLCLAYEGNLTALRLCMERLMPARRQRALHFNLPLTKTLADVAEASESVVRRVSRGQLTTDEGQAVSVLLEGRRRMIETQELDQRLRVLEAINKPSNELR